MINIKIIFPGPEKVGKSLRKLDDLLPYQTDGVKLHLGYNQIGAMHCQNSIEEAYAIAGMASCAAAAEKEGMDAIVIESMGDTGLIQCREAARIPVVGMSDVTLRLAAMLGNRFGLITAGNWHCYAIERLINQYHLDKQYIGGKSLAAQPFFTGDGNVEMLYRLMVKSIIELIEQGADSIVLGGSYFMGMPARLNELLCEQGHHEVLILDPLPNAIHFARFMVEANINHNKRVYQTPAHATPVIGYPGIENTLSLFA